MKISVSGVRPRSSEIGTLTFKMRKRTKNTNRPYGDEPIAVSCGTVYVSIHTEEFENISSGLFGLLEKIKDVLRERGDEIKNTIDHIIMEEKEWDLGKGAPQEWISRGGLSSDPQIILYLLC